jgi:hypothetical protein
MATFAQLVADIKILTNRPDLDSEIKLAVKAATLKAHITDYYPKDLYETAITWSPVAYFQSLAYRTLIPRWRSLKYLRKYTPAVGTTAAVTSTFFEMISPEAAMDIYAINRDNVCYIAGEELNIRSSTEDDYMLLGCYLFPDITETTYSSWVAAEMPFVIEYEATSKIFKMIGYDEQAAMFNKEMVEQFTLLRNTYIQGVGY